MAVSSTASFPTTQPSAVGGSWLDFANAIQIAGTTTATPIIAGSGSGVGVTPPGASTGLDSIIQSVSKIVIGQGSAAAAATKPPSSGLGPGLGLGLGSGMVSNTPAPTVVVTAGPTGSLTAPGTGFPSAPGTGSGVASGAGSNPSLNSLLAAAGLGPSGAGMFGQGPLGMAQGTGGNNIYPVARPSPRTKTHQQKMEQFLMMMLMMELMGGM